MGEDSIRQGITALLAGGALVMVFMIFYYRVAGAFACFALLFNLLIILVVLTSFQATLTLPGIAGIVLTMGMSVDANVLIFERIREELKSAKNARAAVNEGFQKAFWTIFDANITTLLATLALLFFGTGPIKGFAVTLAIGILASMFTAIPSWLSIRTISFEKSPPRARRVKSGGSPGIVLPGVSSHS